MNLFSISLKQDVSNFGVIVQMKGQPYIFDMHISN